MTSDCNSSSVRLCTDAANAELVKSPLALVVGVGVLVVVVVVAGVVVVVDVVVVAGVIATSVESASASHRV